MLQILSQIPRPLLSSGTVLVCCLGRCMLSSRWICMRPMGPRDTNLWRTPATAYKQSHACSSVDRSICTRQQRNLWYMFSTNLRLGPITKPCSSVERSICTRQLKAIFGTCLSQAYDLTHSSIFSKAAFHAFMVGLAPPQETCLSVPYSEAERMIRKR